MNNSHNHNNDYFKKKKNHNKNSTPLQSKTPKAVVLEESCRREYDKGCKP